jgi:HAMP domain-containing protein
MNLESGVSLGQLLLALAVLLGTGGVTWGGLLQRVKTLEREVEALADVATTLATMKAEIGHIKTGIEQITSSWLFREPPGYEAVERPVGAPIPRRPK